MIPYKHFPSNDYNMLIMTKKELYRKYNIIKEVTPMKRTQASLSNGRSVSFTKSTLPHVARYTLPNLSSRDNDSKFANLGFSGCTPQQSEVWKVVELCNLIRLQSAATSIRRCSN